MNVLFVCNQCQNRSKTAQELFSEKFATMAAGLYNEHPLCQKQLDWADTVIVMEDEQRDEIAHRFPKEYMQKRILNLDIPDIYKFKQPELITVLEMKMKDLL